LHNPEIIVLFEWSLKAPSDDFVLTISRLTLTLTTNYFETVLQKELESNDALLTIPVLKYSNTRPHPRSKTAESGGKVRVVGVIEEEQLVKAAKVDANSLAEGTWTCKEAGQVEVCWDNSYSILHLVTISYRESTSLAVSD
jgi:hypothetical protein